VPAVASPTVTRAAHLLKALAAAPEPALPLSEIARRVDLNRASCQTLLLALVAEGLVTRAEPGPTYRLGPGLIHLGDAARSSLDVTELASPHLDALHQRFGATSMAGVPSGGEIVVTAVRAAPHPFGLTVVTGGRTPLWAPIGPIYLAWASTADVDAWIDRADPPLGRTRAAGARRALAQIRARGYSVTIRGPRRANGALDLEELVDERHDDAVRVVGISAAAWDASGRLACSLALTGFAGSMTRREIAEAGDAVCDAALDLTRTLGGGQAPSHPAGGDHP
jgi:DNA-binding IclR family transcriptional regulator